MLIMVHISALFSTYVLWVMLGCLNTSVYTLQRPFYRSCKSRKARERYREGHINGCLARDHRHEVAQELLYICMCLCVSLSVCVCVSVCIWFLKNKYIHNISHKQLIFHNLSIVFRIASACRARRRRALPGPPPRPPSNPAPKGSARGRRRGAARGLGRPSGCP